MMSARLKSLVLLLILPAILLAQKGSSKTDITPLENNHTLPEVTVKGMGMAMKGDTVTYFINHFTTGQERTLGDVIEKLPGIRVNGLTNAIMANGKPVTKILVEQEDLFQGNTTIPLQNLLSAGISSIDVIENHNEYSLLNGFKATHETVININLKQSWKARLSGQAVAQGGVNDKFDIKNTSLMVSKKTLFSGIISANNTGIQVLTTADFVGVNGTQNELISNDATNEHVQRSIQSFAPFGDTQRDVYQRNRGVLALNSVFNPTPKLKIYWSRMLGIDYYHMQSNDQFYYPTTGLSYADNMHRKQAKHQMLSNMKVSYLATPTLNIYYTGRIYADNNNLDNIHDEGSGVLNSNDKSHLFKFDNNVLAVKRLGDHSINLSADFNFKRYRTEYDFRSDSLFYDNRFNLPDDYTYNDNHIERRLSAQLFYLHRLNDTYFFRVGAQSTYDQDTYGANLTPEENNTLFQKYNRVSYLDHNLNLRFSKDKGKFTFTAGLALKAITAKHNLVRSFDQRHKVVVSPNLRASYKVSPTNSITFTYDEFLRTHSVQNLVEGYQMLAYNQMMRSSVDKFYGYVRRASLTHLFRLTETGSTFINQASFESADHHLVNNYSQQGTITDIDKRLYSGANRFTWLSSVEKRHLFMPLVAKISLMYRHSYSPFFSDDELYKSKNNLWKLQTYLGTDFKLGFNGRVAIDHTKSRFNTLLGKNQFANTDYLFLVSYNTSKLYASADVRYRNLKMVQDSHSYFSYDFMVRYDLTSKLSFQLVGDDIFHTAKRIVADTTLHPYFNTNRTIFSMPGSIMAGVLFRY